MPHDEFSSPAPTFSTDDAERLAKEIFGIAGSATPLVSERDQNFKITGDGESFVLKLANPAEDPAIADLQVQALRHIAAADADLPVPRVVPTVNGAALGEATGQDGRASHVRLVTFLPGVTRDAPDIGLRAMEGMGRLGARLQLALRGFFHPAAGRSLIWDVQRAESLEPLFEYVPDASRREIAARVLERFRSGARPNLPRLRAQVVHNDVHPDNVVFSVEDPDRVAGVIDFGDMVFAPVVGDLSVTVSTSLFGRSDPFEAAAAAIGGYLSVTSLEDGEVEVLPELIAARTAASAVISHWRAELHPENLAYIEQWAEEAWQLLELFEEHGPLEVERRFHAACRAPGRAPVAIDLPGRRRRALGPTLPLSYAEPLHLVRGEGVWLYDADGRAYVDAYNNVPVVGHAHPRVVDALARQAARLNTNSRYLHEGIVELAERLIASMPDGLDTCLFVNSGSEANDTAWRLAREAAGGTGAIVADFAYHGITVASSDLSPEEWPSGRTPALVRTIPAPDPYRGPHAGEADWTDRSAAEVTRAAEDLPEGLAMTVVDGSFASSGIFFPPPGYLTEVARRTHASGGLYVADEVQAGFGRTGSMWSFEAAGIAPDFVTLGKPMGNGHPVAAVVTRREIAERFAGSYPEFFSTFGGNTVATAVALAVLDVIEDEGLLRNAEETGAYLRAGIAGLADRYALIGDVRGAGLMTGVELVSDRDTREPASNETDTVVNGLRQRGVLIGSCGPDGNVLKIRPPLPFSREHADLLVEALDATLGSLPS